jgi:hypothetical protein
MLMKSKVVIYVPILSYTQWDVVKAKSMVGHVLKDPSA